MLKAVIFDLDDTLIDWSKQTLSWEEFTYQRSNDVFEYVNRHVAPLQDRQAFFSNLRRRAVDAWENARENLVAPHLGDVLVESLIEFGIAPEKLVKEHLLDAYDWGPFPGVVPFEDSLDVLPRLRERGLRLGLITNAFQPMRLRLRELEAYGLVELLDADCLLSAADVGYLKPHKQIFQVALDIFQFQPEEVVFVGDSYEADIVGAKGIGMRAVQRMTDRYLARGVGEPIEPDATIKSLYELEALLADWYPELG